MVFECVFVNNIIHFEVYHIRNSNPVSDKLLTMADLGLSLLFVSRQLHTETALLPYKLCRLQLLRCCGTGNHDSEAFIRRFFKKRSQEQVEAISDLAVEIYDGRGATFVCLRGTGSFWIEWLHSEEARKWRAEIHFNIW